MQKVLFMSMAIIFKNHKVKTILFVVLFTYAYTVNAQNKHTTETTITLSIPAVALIDFQGNDNVITFKTPTQIEQIITPSALNQTWLNYSSIVESGSTNYITVHISSGILPPESTIKLQIEDDAGAGAGKTGTPITQITLSRYPQIIVNDIGSCYTGRGIEKGHELTYSWVNLEENPNSKRLKDEFEITVTYTIMNTE
jgi:hypothetical protein